MRQKTKIKIPWTEDRWPAIQDLTNALSDMGIDCCFQSDDGRASILVTMDDVEDERVLRLWDELSDLRVRYIEARQERVASQLTYLEGENAPAS